MAVKYTVTISSIIVSHKEKYFLKAHSSHHLCIYMFVFIYSKNNS